MRPSASSSAGRRSFQRERPDRRRPEVQALDAYASAKAKQRTAFIKLNAWKGRADWAEESVHAVDAAIKEAKEKLEEMELEEGKKTSLLDSANDELERCRRNDGGSEAAGEALGQAQSKFDEAQLELSEATAARARALGNYEAQVENKKCLVQRREQQVGELAMAKEAYDIASEFVAFSKSVLDSTISAAGPSGLPPGGASTAVDAEHRIPGSDKVSALHDHYQEGRKEAALLPRPNKLARTEKPKSPSND